MTHMSVTPGDLTSTAKTLEQSVEALQNLTPTASEPQVPDGAFGHIPGLGAHLSSTYRDHLTQSADLLRGATAGLGSVVNSLHATATGMQQMEQNTSQTFSSITGG